MIYDSEIGRFLSIDPAGQQNSPYSYSGNNPVSFTDPSGMRYNYRAHMSASEYNEMITSQFRDWTGDRSQLFVRELGLGYRYDSEGYLVFERAPMVICTPDPFPIRIGSVEWAMGGWTNYLTVRLVDESGNVVGYEQIAYDDRDVVGLTRYVIEKKILPGDPS